MKAKRLTALIVSVAMTISSIPALAMAEDRIDEEEQAQVTETAETEEPEEVPAEEPAADEETEETDDTEVTVAPVKVKTYKDGANDPLPEITYQERYWDADAKEVKTRDKTISSYKVLNSSSSDIYTDAEYLVVDHNLTLNVRLVIKRAKGVNLIVLDGVTLTCNKGITCDVGSEVTGTLNIYAQSQGANAGTIIANGYDGAGIGGLKEGFYGTKAGPINIYGCNIKATGSSKCAGIGSGDEQDGNTINIYGGDITAIGGKYAAGIGGGNNGKGGKITIYDAKYIEAKGGTDGAGIGGGDNKSCGKVTIYGGTITAKAATTEGEDSGSGAAGIGGGDDGYDVDNDKIEIYGGDITATGGKNSGAGIGCGNCNGVVSNNPESCNISVWGGTVNAYGQGSAAGIGGGTNAAARRIEIFGGDITARNYEDGAGIGGGKGKGMTYFHMRGGSVDVSCGAGGAAIGSGRNGDMTGDFTFEGGTINATVNYNGGDHGAAIGSGAGGDLSGFITFSGGSVTGNVNGSSYCRVFGPGANGSDTDASKYIIAADMKVDDNNHIWVSSNDRISAIRSTSARITVEECEHPVIKGDDQYTPDPANPDKHIFTCLCCQYTESQDHDYGTPSWTWTGYESATSHFECAKCHHETDVTATGDDITSEVTKKPTYKEYGVRTYTATVECCGEEYTSTKTQQIDKCSELYGYTLSLDGTVGVNCRMFLTDTVLSHADTAYMEFQVGTQDPQQVYVKDAVMVTDTDPYYVFQCKAPVKDLTTGISIRLVDGDDEVVYPPFVVVEYADQILEHPEITGYAKAAELVKALINYGAYAQVYFDVNTDIPANEGYAYTAEEMDAVTIPEKYKNYDTSLPDSVSFAGTSLALKSDTVLSLYLSSQAEITASCSDAAKTVVIDKAGGYKVIRISGIKANELGSSIKIDLTVDGVSGYYISYSPMTYCYKVLNGASSNKALQNVCKVLYLYNEAAKTYNA